LLLASLDVIAVAIGALAGSFQIDAARDAVIRRGVTCPARGWLEGASLGVDVSLPLQTCVDTDTDTETDTETSTGLRPSQKTVSPWPNGPAVQRRARFVQQGWLPLRTASHVHAIWASRTNAQPGPEKNPGGACQPVVALATNSRIGDVIGSDRGRKGGH